MQPGQFDRKIVIQSPVKVPDGEGGTTLSWQNFNNKESFPAQAIPMTGRERFAAQAEREVLAYRFIIRYTVGLNSSMRIVYDGLKYSVVGLREIGRRMYIEITAEYLQEGSER